MDACAVIAVAVVFAGCAAVPPAAAPTGAGGTAGDASSDAAPQPAERGGVRFADAGALLDAVEGVAAGMRDFRSAVTVETTDDVTGDTERRMGQVVLVQDTGKPETRRFAVVLEKFIDGSGRADDRPVRYVYADGWLTEADFRERTLVRRQLARPGERYDPLKPGEGPVPLPIGQRREDVMRRFEASLADSPESASLKRVTEPMVGLRLRPRPGMADRDLVEATVWYDAQSLVPRGVEARRRNGRTTVILRNAEVNGGLDEPQRALLSLATGATEGWRVDERPMPAEPVRTPDPVPVPGPVPERAP
jgi:hypothetical protein